MPDPAEHYAWADVVTVPSRRPESLGRVAIEAMAWGRPVIASAIGGLTEVVEAGRTGWTLPPGDPQALKAVLLEVLENPASLAPLAAAGRQRYEKLFSRDAVSATIGRIVGQKLARRGIVGAFGLRAEQGAAE
jgi:glycosyltransferase involved in cell wall biosynthesis